MVKENSLIEGNCLKEIQKFEDESIDLIYLDPPFFTQRKHSLKTRDNLKSYEFSDNWNSLEDYLSFIKDSLIEFRKSLKESGNIFFHCDKSASHHIRVLLDDVFGVKNFRSEIIWYYKRWSNAKKGLLNSHQNIYFYSKSNKFKFNTIFTEYSPTTNVDQILQKRARDKNNKSVYARDKNGDIISNGIKKGVPLSDVWEIPFLNPKAKERVGYPTQKPILLMERIIKLVTEENDLVLDPFCGSGTTLVAAKILNRNYIGIDTSGEAIKLSRERLKNPIKTYSKLMERGIDYYKKKPPFELAILDSIKAVPVYRNTGIDGFLKTLYDGKPIPIRIQKSKELLTTAKEKLVAAGKSKGSDFMILIRTSHLNNETFVFEDYVNESVLLIDSYDLIIEKRLDSKDKFIV